MARPLSLDLRERIVDAVKAGLSRRAAVKRFRVSESCAAKLLQRWQRTGSAAPAPMGGSKAFALEPHEALVRELIASQRAAGGGASIGDLSGPRRRAGRKSAARAVLISVRPRLPESGKTWQRGQSRAWHRCLRRACGGAWRPRDRRSPSISTSSFGRRDRAAGISARRSGPSEERARREGAGCKLRTTKRTLSQLIACVEASADAARHAKATLRCNAGEGIQRTSSPSQGELAPPEQLPLPACLMFSALNTTNIEQLGVQDALIFRRRRIPIEAEDGASRKGSPAYLYPIHPRGRVKRSKSRRWFA
jgi:hypothetical protein